MTPNPTAQAFVTIEHEWRGYQDALAAARRALLRTLRHIEQREQSTQ